MDANGIHEDWLVDPHHYIPRSQGGKDVITNCVLIPRDWHDMYHFGNREQILPKITRIYKSQQYKLQKYLQKNKIIIAE